VVLYLNFLYAFGDWWLRSMPTFMHALAAGAWDSRYHLIVATGGQKLEAWQKLMLQTLTDRPVSTLSDASSRAGLTAQHSTAAATDALGAAVGGNSQSEHHQQQEEEQQEQQEQQQRNLLQSQQHHQSPTAAAAAAAPVTAYGRCFELLTICSISDARHFTVEQGTPAEQQTGDSSSSSSRVPRETWAGAQYVRQYYMQRYGQQYARLPEQNSRLKEPGAFRVVFAVRAPAAATAAAADGGGGTVSSSDVQANPSEQQLAASTRQVINIQDLLDWCNSWQPVAAAAADLEGVDSSSTAAAAAAAAAAEARGAQKRYHHTVCVAHQFGQHGQTDGNSSSSSSSGGGGAGGSSSIGWLGRATVRLRQLLSGAVSGSAATATLQQRLHPPGSADRQQQQQQQQWPWGDPDLDPRALMTDIAVMDHAGEQHSDVPIRTCPYAQWCVVFLVCACACHVWVAWGSTVVC
jgi:hypothetical protein